VNEWVTAIGLPREDYGMHSLRRTKASIIYKATGNSRAVQPSVRQHKFLVHTAFTLIRKRRKPLARPMLR
jgi:hypothetical protein